MMNLGVATLIGNRLGLFRDLEVDDSGCSWGASLRIRVGLIANQPFKRALKLRSTSGEELLVRFTYERLPNFCYLCELLGHIDKYCEIRFSDGFSTLDAPPPYGAWLRMPIPDRGSSLRGSNEWRPHISSSSLQGKQACRGATIFWSFGKGKNPAVALMPSRGHIRQSQSSIPTDSGGSRDEEVMSSLIAMKGMGPVDMDIILAEVPSMLQQRKGREMDKAGLVWSDGGFRSGVEGCEEGLAQDSSEHFNKLGGSQLSGLVNIPLRLTTQNSFASRGSAWRGRRPGRGSRGRPMKRDRGIQLIETEGTSVHAIKKRLHLSDDTSDSISTETAGQSHREP
ncbi:UNVERIFIED_CONTAM: hypothetical protein Slati_3125800 [Sesamum latifolium]|uniref:Zinc knuckle CX2CX4HX4C domain-containing protein n=1 Tax=Sesamum latifolium TaxID=2727402 RepID=A0AAW2UUW7_9LAMI